MRLFMIRHGETDMNVKKAYYGSLDVPLNKKGEMQADLFADFFSDIELDKIISSPLIRAYDTAKKVALPKNISIEKDSRIKEQDFGKFEGMSYDEIHQSYASELKRWNDDWINEAPLEGESFLGVYNRVVEFCQELRQMDGNILITAHMGTLRHISSILLNMPMESFWCFEFLQGCYSRLDLEDGYTIIRKMNQSL